MEAQLQSSDFYADPYPTYTRLRAENPVYWSPALGCWLITRYEDVLSSLRNPKFSSAKMPAFAGQLPEDVRDQIEPFILYLSSFLGLSDPPDHSRLRKLANKAFTPTVVQAMEPRIQDIVNTLLDGLEEIPQFDLIQSFAYPLPALVISEVIGLPKQDVAQFKQWSDDIVAFIGGSRPDGAIALRGQTSMLAMVDYYQQLITRRRTSPTNDLLSALLAVEDEGSRLTEVELLATCVTLLAGGHETTTNLIANGMLALLRNPGQYEALRSQPDLMITAVEELLRYDAPVQRAERVTVGPVDVRGCEIRGGDRVLLVIGSANRDSSQFPEADSLNLGRSPNKHLAFGFGTHFCIGSPLARLEAAIAFRALLDRLPKIRLASDELQWHHSVGNRGMISMPVAHG
jgi:cytochrome P450